MDTTSKNIEARIRALEHEITVLQIHGRGLRWTRTALAVLAVGALFVVAHPLCAVVGYMPTLVVAAICVYIGADFLYDNLAEPFAATTRVGM